MKQAKRKRNPRQIILPSFMALRILPHRYVQSKPKAMSLHLRLASNVHSFDDYSSGIISSSGGLHGTLSPGPSQIEFGQPFGGPVAGPTDASHAKGIREETNPQCERHGDDEVEERHPDPAHHFAEPIAEAEPSPPDLPREGFLQKSHLLLLQV